MDNEKITVSRKSVDWALDTLGMVILDSIENPHRKTESEGYRIAICLLPLWCELNPNESQLALVMAAAQNVLNSSDNPT